MGDNQDLDWLRQRLLAIEVEIRNTPAHDVKTRHDLACAADSCRSMLRSGNAKALAAARKSWTERAANKGSHKQNIAALEAMARFMPGDGGAT